MQINRILMLQLHIPKTELGLSPCWHELSRLQAVSECLSSVSHYITERSIWDFANYSSFPGTYQGPSKPTHYARHHHSFNYHSESTHSSSTTCILLCALSLTHSLFFPLPLKTFPCPLVNFRLLSSLHPFSDCSSHILS